MSLRGTFSVSCTVENHIDRDKSISILQLLVDTGSELTWLSSKILEGIGVQKEKKDPTFIMANGQQRMRSVGFAILRIEDRFTIDEVVFAEGGDLLLLGAP